MNVAAQMVNALPCGSVSHLVSGKWRECSTIFEVKRRKSARMFGTGGRSQPESAREADCCTYMLSIRRRETSATPKLGFRQARLGTVADFAQARTGPRIKAKSE